MMRMVPPFHPVLRGTGARDVVLIPSLARCTLPATSSWYVAHKPVHGRACHMLVPVVNDLRSAACFMLGRSRVNGGSGPVRPGHQPPLLRRTTSNGTSHLLLVSGPSARHLHHSRSPWPPQNARTQIRLLNHQADVESHSRENMLDVAQQSLMFQKTDRLHNAGPGNVNNRWGEGARSTSGMFHCL